MSLLPISQDIFFEIFKFLSPEDVERTSRVSKQFFKTCRNSSLWRFFLIEKKIDFSQEEDPRIQYINREGFKAYINKPPQYVDKFTSSSPFLAPLLLSSSHLLISRRKKPNKLRLYHLFKKKVEEKMTLKGSLTAMSTWADYLIFSYNNAVEVKRFTIRPFELKESHLFLDNSTFLFHESNRLCVGLSLGKMQFIKIFDLEKCLSIIYLDQIPFKHIEKIVCANQFLALLICGQGVIVYDVSEKKLDKSATLLYQKNFILDNSNYLMTNGTLLLYGNSQKVCICDLKAGNDLHAFSGLFQTFGLDKEKLIVAYLSGIKILNPSDASFSSILPKIFHPTSFISMILPIDQNHFFLGLKNKNMKQENPSLELWNISLKKESPIYSLVDSFYKNETIEKIRFSKLAMSCVSSDGKKFITRIWSFRLEKPLRLFEKLINKPHKGSPVGIEKQFDKHCF